MPYGTLVDHGSDIPGSSIKARSSRDGRHQAVVAVSISSPRRPSTTRASSASPAIWWSSSRAATRQWPWCARRRDATGLAATMDRARARYAMPGLERGELLV